MNHDNRQPGILFVIHDNYKTERLGIQILSAVAREEGWRTELLILNHSSPNENQKRAREFQPLIVAYSAMTFEQYSLQDFNRRLKCSEIKFLSIFGGHHYTFNPEEIEKDPAIDIVCRGEGEQPFRAVIRAVREGKDYHQIDNLWCRQGDTIVKNPLGELIDNLDTIPFPDRKLLPPVYLHRESQIYGKSVTVMFGRGCPFGCTYCFNSGWNALYRGKSILRHRSVENMLEELRTLVKEFNPDLVYFWDDDFSLLPREVINEFCRRYKSEIGLPFSIHLNASRIDEDLIRLLKATGLEIATMSVECGDENVARDLLKRGFNTNEKLIAAFQLLNKYQIRNYSQSILALPVKNPLEVDWKTIEINIRCRPTVAHYYILLPYPKTEIWEYAINNGFLQEEALDSPNKLPSAYTNSLFNYCDQATADRVNNLHKFASLCTQFPILIPLVKRLIQLPPNRIFQYIFFIWYGYCNSVGLFRTRVTPRLLIGGLRGIRQYLKSR